MANNKIQTVEIRPGEHETMAERLVERCDGDARMAGFFHCLGAAIKGDVVESKHLRANTPDLQSKGR